MFKNVMILTTLLLLFGCATEKQQPASVPATDTKVSYREMPSEDAREVNRQAMVVLNISDSRDCLDGIQAEKRPISHVDLAEGIGLWPYPVIGCSEQTLTPSNKESPSEFRVVYTKRKMPARALTESDVRDTIIEHVGPISASAVRVKMDVASTMVNKIPVDMAIFIVRPPGMKSVAFTRVPLEIKGSQDLFWAFLSVRGEYLDHDIARMMLKEKTAEMLQIHEPLAMFKR